MQKKKTETEKELKPVLKSYEALATKNIGSNPDGTAKIKLTKGQPVQLTKKQAETYLNLNLIK